MVVGSAAPLPEKKGGTTKWLSWAATLAGLVLLILAVWLFGRTLHRYDMEEVLAGLERIPAHRMALALSCAALSYLVQNLYDFFGARSVGLDVTVSKASLAAFIGNAFTNNIGLSLLTGTSLRYRFYSAWGYSALDVAQVIALSKLAFFSGLFTFAGLTQLFAPVSLPPGLAPSISPRLLGLLILIPPAAIFLLNGFSRGGTLKLGKFVLRRPRQSLLYLQTAASCAHLAFAAGTLYFLLPADALEAAGFRGPIGFLGSYMAIKFVVLFFPVPGNLGVFEATSMAVLTPALPAHPVLGALLAYRLAYYVLPFGIALGLMAGFELSSRKGLLAVFTRQRKRAGGIA